MLQLPKAREQSSESDDLVAQRRAPAARPAQVPGPLALPGDPHLHGVEPPEALLPEQVHLAVGTRHRPVGALGQAAPVAQLAGVVGLRAQRVQVQHRVAGALEEDHVTERGVVEGAVRVAGQPQLAALPGEARVQRAARVAPQPLACTTPGGES